MGFGLGQQCVGSLCFSFWFKQRASNSSKKAGGKLRKRIAVDFDGVLHSYKNGWTGFTAEDPPVLGAQGFIRELQRRGYEVIIFSCRANTAQGFNGIEAWLDQYDFPPLAITDSKPIADLYIDDRGYRFDGDFNHFFGWLSANKDLPTWVDKEEVN